MIQTLFVRTATAAFAVAALAGTAVAQTITPAEFKAACEAPGNTVTVTGTLKVTPPVLPPPLVVVNSGCHVALSPDSKFEADNLNVRFTGPVSVTGTTKASALFKLTRWTAPAISASFSGAEGNVSVDGSRLTASAGDLTVSLGDYSKLGVTAPFGGRGDAMNAAGAVIVTGGRKLEGSFETTRLRAGTGMSFSLAGPEVQFTANNTSFTTAAGSFSISSPGSKAQVDLASARITAPAGVSVTMPGEESKAAIVSTIATALAGSVTLQAGSAGRSFGVLAIDKTTVRAGGAFTMLASVGANKGEAVLNNSRITAGANILIRSDIEGLTNLLNNILSSPTEIRAFTGASGACIAEGNEATAPIVVICP